jgi:hypothetical protein
VKERKEKSVKGKTKESSKDSKRIKENKNEIMKQSGKHREIYEGEKKESLKGKQK